jgi:hypothetical protein
LYRNQAWWKIQFFAGDRAGDLALVVAQEVNFLTDGSGLVFQHTFGKTLRGSSTESVSAMVIAHPARKLRSFTIIYP